MILPEKSSGISLSCQTLRRSPSCPLFRRSSTCSLCHFHIPTLSDHSSSIPASEKSASHGKFHGDTLSNHNPSVGITQIRYGRRSIFLSACHTSSRSLFSVIIAPTCKNVKQDQALFLFCFSFLFSHPNAIIQMITDSNEPVAVASPIGNSVSGKIFEVR